MVGYISADKKTILIKRDEYGDDKAFVKTETISRTEPPEYSDDGSELSGGECREEGSPITTEVVFSETQHKDYFVNAHGDRCYLFYLVADGNKIEICGNVSDDIKKGDKVSVTYQVETCRQETEGVYYYDSNRLVSVNKIDGSATTFTDPRDKKTYKTVKMGEQVWMAENLNFEAKEGSMCYDNKPANCQKYGRLYDWETAMKACPNGWHLPSDKEWQTLVDFAGGVKVAGKKLKANSGG